MITSETDFYKVSLDDARKVATLSWNREVKQHEFKRGCQELANLFRQANISKCLIESTKRGTLAYETQEWLDTLQATSNSTAHRLHIALVMTEERYQHLIYEYSLAQTYTAALPIQFNYFTNSEEAMDWLLHETVPLD